MYKVSKSYLFWGHRTIIVLFKGGKNPPKNIFRYASQHGFKVQPYVHICSIYSRCVELFIFFISEVDTRLLWGGHGPAGPLYSHVHDKELLHFPVMIGQSVTSASTQKDLIIKRSLIIHHYNNHIDMAWFWNNSNCIQGVYRWKIID